MPYGIKTIFQTAIDEYTHTDVEELGTIRWEGEKVYKWVESALVTVAYYPRAGEVGVYFSDRYDESLVLSHGSSGDGLGAGVWQSNQDLSSGGVRFSWIQIKGPSVISVAVTAGVAGDAMTSVGADDSTLDVMAGSTATPVANLTNATAPITKGSCDTVSGSKVIALNSVVGLVVGDTVFGAGINQPIVPFSVIVSIDAVAKTVTMDKPAIANYTNIDIVFSRQKIMCDFPF